MKMPDGSDACLQALRRIERLLRDGDAAVAFEQAQAWFAPARTPVRLRADLCNLTGAAAHALGLTDLAAQMWRQAIACAAPQPAVVPWFNLAQLHAEQGHLDDAENCLRTVLRLEPRHADAAARLGALLARSERLDDARAWLTTALEVDPGHAAAQADLALLWARAGQMVQAESAYARALLLDPTNASVHTHLGVLMAATRRPAQAVACHLRALELDPGLASAHTNLGLVLASLKRFDDALVHQQRAHALAPGSAQICTNLGNLLARRGDETSAEQLLRQAVAIDPHSASCHVNLGVLLADQGRDAAAEQHLRRALALRPGHALARLDLSTLLLAQGRYAEGWVLHEARHDPQLPDCGIAPPPLDVPAWAGESLTDKAILVWPEQGLGDQIQFCRFVPALKALGATRVTLVCQRPLQALFETVTGVDRVIVADVVDNAFHVEPADLGQHDVWTYPLSLPRWLRTELSSLPGASMPYLRAPVDRRHTWAARLTGHGTDSAEGRNGALRVGLVWRGNPLHSNDAQRSLPDLQTLAPLWSVPDVRFVSLQTGADSLQADGAPRGQPILALGGALQDFADTAAVLESLDLLICVDTSIAHLAGALGRPCWVMLPHRKTDWRWLRRRDESPWYPLGMRLYRQAARGDWPAVVTRLVQDLRAEVARRPRRHAPA